MSGRIGLEKVHHLHRDQASQRERLYQKAIVEPLYTREEVQAQESGAFVERTFSGSLPQFLTAFLGGRKKLSSKEAAELKDLIDSYHE